MNSKENLSGGEIADSGSSPWDNVEFPEFSPEDNTEEETIDVDKLAQDLVAARKDSKEGATWDKEQHTYIGEDGLPRDWAHLVGYLRKNPDAIKTATEALQTLQTHETLSEDAVAESTEEESPATIATEAEESPAEEVAETKEAEAENELDERSQSIIDFYKKQSKDGNGIPDNVVRYYYRNQDDILSRVSDKVKDACEFGDTKRQLAMTQRKIDGAQSKLDDLPRFTLPWSKNGREKRELRKAIKANEQKAESLLNTISNYEEEFKNNPLSDKEKATVDAIESIPKLILQGAEKKKQELQDRLKLLDRVEKELELPNDKRDWDLIEQIQPWARNHSEEYIRDRIQKQRENDKGYLKEIEKGYEPLRQEQEAA